MALESEMTEVNNSRNGGDKLFISNTGQEENRTEMDFASYTRNKNEGILLGTNDRKK